MNTQTITTTINGKNIQYEFVARAELTAEEFRNLNSDRLSYNPVPTDWSRWNSVHGDDDLEEQADLDSNLNEISSRLDGATRFVYRFMFV